MGRVIHLPLLLLFATALFSLPGIARAVSGSAFPHVRSSRLSRESFASIPSEDAGFNSNADSGVPGKCMPFYDRILTSSQRHAHGIPEPQSQKISADNPFFASVEVSLEDVPLVPGVSMDIAWQRVRMSTCAAFDSVSLDSSISMALGGKFANLFVFVDGGFYITAQHMDMSVATTNDLVRSLKTGSTGKGNSTIPAWAKPFVNLVNLPASPLVTYYSGLMLTSGLIAEKAAKVVADGLAATSNLVSKLGGGSGASSTRPSLVMGIYAKSFQKSYVDWFVRDYRLATSASSTAERLTGVSADADDKAHRARFEEVEAAMRLTENMMSKQPVSGGEDSNGQLCWEHSENMFAGKFASRFSNKLKKIFFCVDKDGKWTWSLDKNENMMDMSTNRAKGGKYDGTVISKKNAKLFNAIRVVAEAEAEFEKSIDTLSKQSSLGVDSTLGRFGRGTTGRAHERSTRHENNEVVKDGKKDIFDSIKTGVSNMVDDVVDFAGKTADKIGGAYEKAKKKFAERRDRVLRYLSDAVRDVSESSSMRGLSGPRGILGGRPTPGKAFHRLVEAYRTEGNEEGESLLGRAIAATDFAISKDATRVYSIRDAIMAFSKKNSAIKESIETIRMAMRASSEIIFNEDGDASQNKDGDEMKAKLKKATTAKTTSTTKASMPRGGRGSRSRVNHERSRAARLGDNDRGSMFTGGKGTYADFNRVDRIIGKLDKESARAPSNPPDVAEDIYRLISGKVLEDIEVVMDAAKDLVKRIGLKKEYKDLTKSEKEEVARTYELVRTGLSRVATVLLQLNDGLGPVLSAAKNTLSSMSNAIDKVANDIKVYSRKAVAKTARNLDVTAAITVGIGGQAELPGVGSTEIRGGAVGGFTMMFDPCAMDDIGYTVSSTFAGAALYSSSEVGGVSFVPYVGFSNYFSKDYCMARFGVAPFVSVDRCIDLSVALEASVPTYKKADFTKSALMTASFLYWLPMGGWASRMMRQFMETVSNQELTYHSTKFGVSETASVATAVAAAARVQTGLGAASGLLQGSGIVSFFRAKEKANGPSAWYASVVDLGMSVALGASFDLGTATLVTGGKEVVKANFAPVVKLPASAVSSITNFSTSELVKDILKAKKNPPKDNNDDNASVRKEKFNTVAFLRPRYPLGNDFSKAL